MTLSLIKGLQCIRGRFQIRSARLEVCRCERINTAKQKDELTSFLMLNDLEAKIFQYGFLEDHMVCENNLY